MRKELAFLPLIRKFVLSGAGSRQYSVSKKDSRSVFEMKLETPEFKSIFTEELGTLHSVFQKYGYGIKIAGGAVRDLLLGDRPSDLDFATVATPDEMKKMFDTEGIRMINMKGEKHGTITARINEKENFEITTLRVDKVTFGRHAEVEFITDWAVDAGRRDLTINAMFLDLDGHLVDYFNGYEDLKHRRIKFVGHPAQRIQEDYLRILRYFRFYGRFAVCPNSHDVGTIEAIRENADGLEIVSGERIWLELRKILSGRFAAEMIHKIIDLGVAKYVGLCESPNLAEFDLVRQRCQENGLTLHSVTLLASLMHNLDDVIALHSRLKLSAFERDLAVFVVTNREDTLEVRPLKLYKGLVLRNRNKSLKDAKEYAAELIKYKGHVSVLSEFLEWNPVPFPVKGGMLKEGGVPGGRMMTLVLERLKDLWIESDCELTAAELVKNIPSILEDLKPSIQK